MAADLISKKTRTEFREYFVSTTIREIQTEFDAADVPCSSDHVPNVTGQRRYLVEQYYHAVDWAKWADVRKILTVYENVLAGLEDLAENDNDWAKNCFSRSRSGSKKMGTATTVASYSR